MLPSPVPMSSAQTPATTATCAHSARRCAGIACRRASQSGHHEHHHRRTRQQREQVIADRDAGQIHDQQKQPRRPRGSPVPPPDVSSQLMAAMVNVATA